MITHEQAVQFLRRNPALSASVLEKEAGLPASTLLKAVAGDRVLNVKHLGALFPVLIRYGYQNQPKARVISVVNHKGGVGKTTTTLNLGRALSRMNYRVLLIDMDSQGNLSQALGVDEPEKQVKHALLDNEPLPILNIGERYDLSPSDLELAYADLELVQVVGGVNQLRNAISPLRSEYDYILIDCPPALNIFTNSALVASQSCLVTLQPEVSALKGINSLIDRITQVRDRINHELTVEGIVLTMVDRRLKLHRDMIEYVHTNLSNFRIFKTEIRLNVSLKESQVAQRDVFTYAKESHGAQDYLKLAHEFTQPAPQLLTA
ncbi:MULTISPECIES: ParA family protein [Spirosoma]|uniref:ParA family protein n=1 Tax=Spirosoma sordidisoli TaxID=2502893 RepID=A0A4Q2UI75_9BACT|nr:MULTISPECIES: ParA family protein [Spirosoma]RYC67063.1 ParA family protein [Spirosoma sordidisoli]RYC67191.1 ParA family protein [Spirosoma sordidisoli]